jgi:hypothetical protein
MLNLQLVNELAVMSSTMCCTVLHLYLLFPVRKHDRKLPPSPFWNAAKWGRFYVYVKGPFFRGMIFLRIPHTYTHINTLTHPPTVALREKERVGAVTSFLCSSGKTFYDLVFKFQKENSENYCNRWPQIERLSHSNISANSGYGKAWFCVLGARMVLF